MRRAVWRTGNNSCEEVQKRKVEQVKSKGCPCEPTDHPLEPTCRHRQPRLGKTENEQSDDCAEDVIICREFRRQPARARMPKQMLATHRLQRDEPGQAGGYHRGT